MGSGNVVEPGLVLYGGVEVRKLFVLTPVEITTSCTILFVIKSPTDLTARPAAAIINT